jgi:hypothetical protein
MAAVGEGGGEVEITIGDGRVKYEEAFRNHVPLLHLISNASGCSLNVDRIVGQCTWYLGFRSCRGRKKCIGKKHHPS